MSEPASIYDVEQSLLIALLRVLTPGQIAMLSQQMSQVLSSGFGQVTIQVRGSRVFITREESYDCGKAVDKNG